MLRALHSHAKPPSDSSRRSSRTTAQCVESACSSSVSMIPFRSPIRRPVDARENSDDRQMVGFTTNGRAGIARPSTDTMTDATTSAVAIAAIAAA
jgi:hypothetical protein